MQDQRRKHSQYRNNQYRGNTASVARDVNGAAKGPVCPELSYVNKNHIIDRSATHSSLCSKDLKKTCLFGFTKPCEETSFDKPIIGGLCQYHNQKAMNRSFTNYLWQNDRTSLTSVPHQQAKMRALLGVFTLYNLDTSQQEIQSRLMAMGWGGGDDTFEISRFIRTLICSEREHHNTKYMNEIKKYTADFVDAHYNDINVRFDMLQAILVVVTVEDQFLQANLVNNQWYQDIRTTHPWKEDAQIRQPDTDPKTPVMKTFTSYIPLTRFNAIDIILMHGFHFDIVSGSAGHMPSVVIFNDRYWMGSGHGCFNARENIRYIEHCNTNSEYDEETRQIISEAKLGFHAPLDLNIITAIQDINLDIIIDSPTPLSVASFSKPPTNFSPNALRNSYIS